jgi:inner membrane protein
VENLTHSLVGLLCAEVVVRVAERRRPLDAWSRGAIYAIAIIGNNLPDLDFAYSRISGPRFGYLLQHRGYTHTVVAAFGFALATLATVFGLSKWQRRRPSPRDWRLFAALALASPLLHIAMDFTNNYGVHPFWPLYDGWFYGDSVFILEPSFWLVLIAPLLLSYRSKLVRGLLGLILALAIGALWYRPFVPRANAAVLTLITISVLAFARNKSPFLRMLLAGFGFFVVLGSFVLGSRLTKVLVRERARSAFPTARTLDVVATPMPANPLCWNVLLVQKDDQQYFVRLGRAALAPSWLAVADCPYDRASRPTAPLQTIQQAPDSRLVLSQEYRVSLADLRAVARERCAARALLRFARVPYLSDLQADGSRVIGDLRYDRNPGLDFSDVRLGRKHAGEPDWCPEYVPPWRPPRSEILSIP